MKSTCSKLLILTCFITLILMILPCWDARDHQGESIAKVSVADGAFLDDTISATQKDATILRRGGNYGLLMLFLACMASAFASFAGALYKTRGGWIESMITSVLCFFLILLGSKMSVVCLHNGSQIQCSLASNLWWTTLAGALAFNTLFAGICVSKLRNLA